MKISMRSAGTAASLSVALLVVSAARAQVTTNLLTNPGAESGTNTGGTIPGWTSASTGGSTNPGVDSGTFDTSITPHTGTYDFYGGNNSLGTLTQAVSLVGNQGITAAQVDTGKLTAYVSFWEQGLSQGSPSDDASVSLIFLNSASTPISTVTSTVIDSHNGTWTQNAQSFAIPTGTRTVNYQINFIRNSGSDNDSFVDDNSLTVTSSATPEPGALALVASVFPLLGVVRRFRGKPA